ncbi:MAG: ATP-dependent DNA helicase RecG [Syntrophomonadaceae bacterium]|nr:ATP-dependent DNA helicase RecG [Syntrophomonadaceae bacterium]
MNNPDNIPVQAIKGVGSRRAVLLQNLGIVSIGDLLRHYPRRHEDRRQVKDLAALVSGTTATVEVRVTGVEVLRPRRNLTVIRAAITDGTRQAVAVWFNQAYLLPLLRQNPDLVITGKPVVRAGKWELTVQQYEVIGRGDSLNTGRIVPFYPALAGLNQRFFRTLIYSALDFACQITDILPEDITSRYGLISLQEALRAIHFPQNFEELTLARKRLAFEELLLHQLALIRLKTYSRQLTGRQHCSNMEVISRFLKSLPFTLTGAQKKAIREVALDMAKPTSMFRLVQGDVGCGKTVVAAAAMVLAAASGWQAAFLTPTEILAEQHCRNLSTLLAPLGIRPVLLRGELPVAVRRQVLKDLSCGEAKVVVGTHALLSQGVNFACLSLAVIDEQHRFGVRQRAVLQQKGKHPDVLVMSATPIPRSLALTLYGDIDISVIDELPPGRSRVVTRFVEEADRKKVYEFLRQQVNLGRQAYVVCPMIDETENIEIRSAVQLADELSRGWLKGLRLGVLHGKMKPQDREKLMDEFCLGHVQVLVATTVVEVGLDVPNAAVMVIEGAERFGLAQLHQLRGRIGRGRWQSYCLMLGNPVSYEARERVRILTEISDGFLIAEADLRLRGPGDFFGTRQHGQPGWKIADPVADYLLALQARQEAERIAAFFGKETSHPYRNIMTAIENIFCTESWDKGV